MSSDGIDFQPISQGSSDGIDFQPLDQSPPQSPGLLNQVASGIQTVKDKAAPYIAMGQQNSPPLPLPWQMGIQANDLINQGFNKAGTAIAENTGKVFPNVNPNIPAAVGTVVAMTPNLAQAYMGLKNVVGDPYLQSPKTIGAQMQTGEEAAGISQQLPVRIGSAPKFAKEASNIGGGLPIDSSTPPVPISYPKNTNALLNFMKDRLDQYGQDLNPQELAHYKAILPEMFKSGEIAPGTKPYALASQVQTQVNGLYNQLIPGRDDLNQAYRVATNLRNPTNMLPQAVTDAWSKRIVPWGERAAGVYGAYRVLKGLLGGDNQR